jgi:hypothetical protein
MSSASAPSALPSAKISRAASELPSSVALAREAAVALARGLATSGAGGPLGGLTAATGVASRAGGRELGHHRHHRRHDPEAHQPVLRREDVERQRARIGGRRHEQHQQQRHAQRGAQVIAVLDGAPGERRRGHGCHGLRRRNQERHRAAVQACMRVARERNARTGRDAVGLGLQRARARAVVDRAGHAWRQRDLVGRVGVSAVEQRRFDQRVTHAALVRGEVPQERGCDRRVGLRRRSDRKRAAPRVAAAADRAVARR